MKNSSVYDPYWSYTPMFIAIYIFINSRAFMLMNVIFLIVFCTWSIRLTLNWIRVFTDFSYEDWRYKKYRDESGRIFWPIVNFCGIHMMPTILVFAGMLPLFELVKIIMNYKAIPGIIVMLIGISLEYL